MAQRAHQARSGKKAKGINPIYQARLDMKGRKQKVLKDAQEISNQDVVLEQLAHHGAYGRLDNTKLTAWGYRQAGAVEDPESGFRVVLYMPTEEALNGSTEQGKIAQMIHGGPPPPVVAFRGTDPKRGKRGISDDVNREGVGTYQFSSNRHRVDKILARAGGKAVVTGHSLGGALAQICAARLPGSVSRVVTYQAPAIGGKDVKALEKHNKQAKAEDKVSSTHYRAEGDIVHTAGEKLTSGDVYTFESVGIGWAGDHMQFPLARLNAARGKIVPGVTGQGGREAEDRLVRINKSDAKEEKDSVGARVAEWGRKNLLGFLRDDDMEPYVKMWEKVNEMIEAGIFTLAYILGIIKSSDRITQVQKVKMRDAVIEKYDG
jgi:pimeloyl-ACP methyl ester carboxylesterase